MISVCMATYNGERHLREQLDSILACIGPDDELICSDDGSTDSTRAILDGYARSHSSVRVVEGPRKGPVLNFGFALSQARGDIIFLSDQDDVWREDKVERVAEVFARDNCSVVVHDALLVDGSGGPLGETLFSLRGSRPGLAKNLIKNSYVGCCMALRRELLSAALPIPEGIEMHDWWIGLISDTVAKSSFIEEQLICYRRHGSNVSSMHHHPIKKMLANRLAIASELVKRMMRVKLGGFR